MNNIPNEIEDKILLYIDNCKSKDLCCYNLVCKNWNNKLKNKKCYKINIFNRDICGYHNEKIIQMIRNGLFYSY